MLCLLLSLNIQTQSKDYKMNYLVKQSQHEANLSADQPSTLDLKQQNPVELNNQQKIDLNLQFCLLAVLLKLLPILLFFVGTDIKILRFTLVLLAASVDFWTFKNISGKELVGMVWWMKIHSETGKEQWIFHSNHGYILDKLNLTTFWATLVLGNLFWGISLLLSLIISSLFWISLCAFCFLLNVVNFGGFVKCKGKHSQKVKDLASQMGLNSARRFIDY